MNEDEKTLAIMQAILYAALTISTSMVGGLSVDERLTEARRVSHLIAQNTDLNSGAS